MYIIFLHFTSFLNSSHIDGFPCPAGSRGGLVVREHAHCFWFLLLSLIHAFDISLAITEFTVSWHQRENYRVYIKGT